MTAPLMPLAVAVFTLCAVVQAADPVPVHPYRLDAVIVLTSEAGWELLASDANTNLAQVLADPTTDAVEFRGLRMEVDQVNSVDMHQDLHWPESLNGKDVSYRRPASNRLGTTLDVRIIEVRDPTIRVEAHLEQTVLHAWDSFPPFGHVPIMGKSHGSAEVDCPLGTWTVVRWPHRKATALPDDLFAKAGNPGDLAVTGLLVRVRKVAK